MLSSPVVSRALTAALFSSRHLPGNVNTTTGSTVVVGVVVAVDVAVDVVVADVVCEIVTVMLVVRVGDVVAVLVTVLVTVVVTVDVIDVVCDDVAEDVGVVEGVVVGELVTLVVGDVVGVVTSQSWNPPASNASVIALIVSAAASQSAPSKSATPNAHATSSSLPAGPRNSRSALFNAVLVAPHWPVTSTSASMPCAESDLQLTSPVHSVSHAASTRFSAATCAWQLWCPST